MKTVCNLYIDAEVKYKAKELGINMSNVFNNMLSLEVEMLEDKKDSSDKEVIKLLKHKYALVVEVVNNQEKEIDSLKKQIPKVKTYSKLELDR